MPLALALGVVQDADDDGEVVRAVSRAGTQKRAAAVFETEARDLMESCAIIS